MGVSEKYHQKDDKNAAADSEKRVSVRSPLKPVFTKATTMEKRNADEEDEYSCSSTTPTGRESRIQGSFTCPPAPKKRKPASSSSSRCINYGGIIEFFNPPDLESIFIRRVKGLN